MKKNLVACIFLLLSCNKEKNNTVIVPGTDTISSGSIVVEDVDAASQIKIVLNDSTTLVYKKAAYDNFKNWYNTMALKKVLSPDDGWKNFISLKIYKNSLSEFTSEVGQDKFYQLYTFNLQQVNGVNKYKKERYNLFSAYQNLNKLKGYYENGGTYFAHMHDRIYAYVEYSLYQTDKGLSDKLNTIELNDFIIQLKNTYRVKLNEDTSISQKEIDERIKVSMKIIDEVKSCIKTDYELKEVKQFYSNYYNFWM